MGTFRHAGNSILIIDSMTQSTYPADWWIANEEVGYVTPENLVEHIYQQGIMNRIYTFTGQVDGDMPWVNGDTYISKKAIYDAAYFKYIHTLQQLKDIKKAEIDAYSNGTVKEGGVVFYSVTYPSHITAYDRMFRQHAKYTRDLGVPVGHYVLDIAGVHQSVNLTEHEDLLDIIIELHVLCDVNADAHKEAVQALATKESVISYDYLTGWATLPYDPS